MAEGGGGFANLGGGIGAGIGLLMAGGGGTKYLREAVNIWRKLEESNFDMSALSAPEREILAQAFPEQYQAVIVGQPEMLQVAPGGREAELRGLSRFERIAEEGLPLADRLATEDVQGALGREYRSAQEDVLRDLASRGRLSIGDEISARLGANQGAQDLAARMARDTSAMRIANRVTGAEAASGLGSRIRGADIDVAAKNAAAMNRFNELASQLKTGAAQYGAGARERAQGYNIGTRQRVGEANAIARYETALENLNRKNELLNTGFNQRLAKTRGLTDALSQRAGLEERKRAEKIAIASSLGRGIGGIGDSASSFGGFGLGG